MYAIVEIAGQQFKVEEGKKIFVHRLEAGEGDSLEFEKVLLVEDNDKILVGEPTVKDLVVEAKVVTNVRGDKVIVFKKKRKKGYRVKNGHRQNFTQIEIVRIGEKSLSPKPSAKKAASKPAEPETAVAETVTEAEVSEKKAAPKKAAVKKEISEEKPKKAAADKEKAKKPAAGKTTKSKK